MKKTLILKIGSSTLTAGSNRISRGKIEDIARQIVVLQKHHNIAIVSSGAIATAKHFIEVNNWQLSDSRQALSAIGQPILMQIYNEIFRDFGIASAQCLLTYRDFDNTEAQTNIKNTLSDLFKNNFIPIINENDTIAIDEIVFGDNDKLSAYVANLLNADLLMLASDIDGLFDKNPQKYSEARLISEINDVEDCQKYVDDSSDNLLGTGGMTSKVQAAEICARCKTQMWIVNGNRNNFILDSIDRKTQHTRFVFD
ncbi:MAG: glutamate 5-kinase [Proteobacteria bacterium]|nr:glutamate 5-kinase [Pseudomonadota bacterium]